MRLSTREGVKRRVATSTAVALCAGLLPFMAAPTALAADANTSAATEVASLLAAADTKAPTVPSGFSSTTTNTQITLKWKASTDDVKVTGYNVIRAGGTGIIHEEVSTANVTHTGLLSNTTYKYKVAARDAASNQSAYVETVATTKVATKDTTAPTSPSTLKGSASGQTVKLTWKAATDNVGVDNYVITRTGADGTKKYVSKTNSYDNTYVNKGTYRYVVVARDKAGNVSGASNAISVTVSSNPADTQKPTVPANVKAAVSDKNVKVTWAAATDNIGVTGYRVTRSGPGGTKSFDVTNLSFSDSNLANGTYKYSVAARDAAGNWSATSTAVSAIVNVDTTDTTAPSVPKEVVGTASTTGVTVSWAASTDNVAVTQYQITRTGGTGTKTFTTKSTNYTDKTVVAETTYKYTIKAGDAASNWSAASTAVTVKTPKTDTDNPAPAGQPLGGDPREDAIYFMMTARWADGDESNNRGGVAHVDSGNAAENDPMFRGDFKGVIENLDYIKGLGFSAIWITPVVLNRSDYDFHGYHGYDFYRVDPRLESKGATYQDLINAAHAKGIKIYQDVIYNHSSRWGAKGLFTATVYGVRDKDWSWYYSAKEEGREYDPLDVDERGFPYNGDIWSETQPEGQNCKNWGTPMGYSKEGYRTYNCQWPNATSGMFPSQYFHQCWIGNWEGKDAQDCWIHEDLADFNTENAEVQEYLINAYNKYVDMGVDGFRVDTVVHVPRVLWNRHFMPALYEHAEAKFGEKGKDFYVFGEVAQFVHDKWNRGSVNHSAPFYTWKERGTFSADDAKAIDEAFFYENDQGLANQPTSDNHLLRGNDYHTPDHSKFSGMNIIDMRMHMNFGEASSAFHNGMDSDDITNDATYNAVYVDSHDYGPNKSSVRFDGGTDAWAENMSLMWTFRGVPILYYGSEIEFQAGAPIDCGPTCPLATTGRAYFGDHLEGSVTASDFGVVSSASGAVAETLKKPLVKHLQTLNQIRRAVPALQKGQYSTEGVSGNMAFKRRYTDGTTDSFVAVAITDSATFTGIPNGTYVDAVTGDTKTVSNGTLSISLSGKGNMRAYVLSTAKTSAPGKVGEGSQFLK